MTSLRRLLQNVRKVHARRPCLQSSYKNIQILFNKLTNICVFLKKSKSAYKKYSKNESLWGSCHLQYMFCHINEPVQNGQNAATLLFKHILRSSEANFTGIITMLVYASWAKMYNVMRTIYNICLNAKSCKQNVLIYMSNSSNSIMVFCPFVIDDPPKF